MHGAGYGRLTFDVLPAKDGSLVHELEIDETIEAFQKDMKKIKRVVHKKKFPFDEKIQDAYIGAYVVNWKTGLGQLPGPTVPGSCINKVSKYWSYSPTTLKELNWALIDDRYRGQHSITKSKNGLWLHEGGHAFYGQHTLKEGILNSAGQWIFNQFLLLDAYQFQKNRQSTLVSESAPQPVIQPARQDNH